MFRELRRIKQKLTEEEIKNILEYCNTGVLAVLGDDNYPYTIPLNYLYHKNSIYFHCALSGHKIDAIKEHNKVSFCVIDQDTVIPETFSTNYKSVVVFGRAKIISDKDEILWAINEIAKKYNPNGKKEDRVKEIELELKRLCIVRIDIDHMSGKQALALANSN